MGCRRVKASRVSAVVLELDSGSENLLNSRICKRQEMREGQAEGTRLLAC